MHIETLGNNCPDVLGLLEPTQAMAGDEGESGVRAEGVAETASHRTGDQNHPGGASARIHAVRFTVVPNQSVPRRCAGPRSIPTLTTIGLLVGHEVATITAISCRAASTAATGLVNTEKVESPSPFERMSSPPACSTRSATSES